MTKIHRRILALALALMTAAALLPGFLMKPAAAESDLGITTADKVNLRIYASPKAGYIVRLPAQYVCTVLSETDQEGYHWFQVTCVDPESPTGRTQTGYIRGDCFRRLTDEEAANYTKTGTASGGSGDAVNTNTSVEGMYGIVVNGSGVNVRQGPGTKYRSLLKLNRGDTVTILEAPSIKNSSETFYKIQTGSTVGYIMSTFLQESGAPAPVPSPTSAPSPTDVVGYVITTMSGVNLRATMGGTVIRQLGKGETYPYLLAPTKKGGYTWYFVQAGNNRGYLRNDVVKVVGSSPDTPTAAPTATPADNTGYVITTAGGVNLRKNAGFTDPIGRVDRGVILPYYETSVVKDVTWFQVVHPTLGTGWLHGSYVATCDEKGNRKVDPSGGNSGSSNSAQEASYNTLKVGSTGDAVLNLTTELKNQGYYKGSVTRNYTTTVANAVRAFQRDKGLTVDGVAGAATQHKLYGTVPIGAGDNSNLEFVMYPAEKIDWYNGGINELWARGDNYKVYDVKTGIVWWAHRWAGGYHVDAEPLTAADTARLCKSYGVTTAQEIADKNLWQRRPLLVTIGTRTFACSLYGVPHNYPEGDTISTNEFKGQLCIHFTNSRTHTGSSVDKYHTEAIEYAWENAPNGHK